MAALSSMSLAAPPRVVDTMNEDIAQELAGAFTNVTTIAVDTEGVNLSRQGRISIVQVATSDCCFLVDVLDKSHDDSLVIWLRGLLEDPSIVKIIHDCRMDSDALFHLLRINLVNVHDTSCWHAAITHNSDSNLNTMLMHYRLQPNVFRDKSVYKSNPSFWALRPLTSQMIQWASGDVSP